MSHISAAALLIDAANDDGAPPMFAFLGQSLNGLQFGLMQLLPAASLTLVSGTLLISAPAATSLNDGIARRGLAVVTQGRQILPDLSVQENLSAFGANRNASDEPRTLERLYAPFPASGRALAQHGRPALGWRAADARHRPHADEEPALADPRRGDSTQLAADPGLWHRCIDVHA